MSAGPINNAQAERFRRLAWPLMPVVLRTAQCLTRRADRAEDLAQDTMVKAMRAIDSYQDDTDMKAWLLTILRRTHIDELRVTRNRPLALSLDAENVDLPALPGADNGDPDVGRFDEQWDEPEELMNRFDDEAVVEALRALPEDIRWTLLLVDVEQMEQAEAAKVLGVAVGTIKSRTHRGRAMLRDRLYETAIQRGWVCAKEESV
jgi:RNA polymerase sigma-70 factor (ECF subfamily)